MTRRLGVLSELKLLTANSRLVFPNERKPQKPMSQNTILYALYRMGYHSRATGHGFRSSASTMLSQPSPSVRSHAPAATRWQSAANRAPQTERRKRRKQSAANREWSFQPLSRRRIETTRLAFEFLILTAARTSEALGAKWDEIDIGSKTWTIPAGRMKAKRLYKVPLAE